MHDAAALPSDRVFPELPISAHREEIERVYTAHTVFLLLGETGSGKSTQLAKILARGNRRVACSEPRVLAATTLARRVSEEMMQTGQRAQVGCATTALALMQMPKTKRVCYTTHRALLMAAALDPCLQKFDCVVLDEAHERSVETDLLLGVLCRISEMRAGFRFVLASATLAHSLAKFSEHLGSCPVIQVKGREYPVSISYLNLSFSDKDVSKTCVGVVRQILQEHESGGVLCFLPSVADIESACNLLANGQLEVLPLHSRLTPQEQERVFAAPSSQRRVVFATNIAETAVTVPGTSIVVDCGFERTRVWCAHGSSKLVTAIVSQSSATQRAGRAGRERPGHCYRLYSHEEFISMDAEPVPEILRVELGSAVLRTRALGVGDVSQLSLIDTPDKAAWAAGEKQLSLLGALEEEDGVVKLTRMGKAMSLLPVEPRLAAVALRGSDGPTRRIAVLLAAVLTVAGRVFCRAGGVEEKDRADRRKMEFATEDGDVTSVLQVFAAYSHLTTKRAANRWCTLRSLNAKSLQSARETQVELERLVVKHQQHGEEEMVGMTAMHSMLETQNEFVRKALLEAYFENVCVFTGFSEEGYMPLRDRSARVFIHPSSVLAGADSGPRWIIFLERMTTSQDFVTTCTVIDSEWLLEVLSNEQLCWLGLGEGAEAQARAVSALDHDIMQERTVRPGLSHLVVEEMSALDVNLAHALREELRSISPRAGPCHLRVEAWNGHKVRVWARLEMLEAAVRLVDEKIKQVEEALAGQVVLRSVHDAGSVKVVLGQGMCVRSVMEPGEFCALEIRCHVPENVSLSRSDIKAALRSAGIKGTLAGKARAMGPAPSRASGNTRGERVGVLTLDSPEDAQSALLKAPVPVSSAVNLCLQLSAVALDANASCREPRIARDATANLLWRRRLFTGNCRVACRPGESPLVLSCLLALRLRHRHLPGGIVFEEYVLNASLDNQKPDSIFVRGISLERVVDATGAAAELKRVFQEMCQEFGPLVSDGGRWEEMVSAVHLLRAPAPTPEQDAQVLTRFKNQIRRVLSEMGIPSAAFTLEIPQPKPKDFDYKARLRSNGHANHLAAAAFLELQGLPVEHPGGVSCLKVEPQFSTSVRCLQKAYRSVSAQVNAALEATQPAGKNSLPRSKVFDDSSSKHTTIIVYAESPALLAKARDALSALLEGSELSLTAPASVVQLLFSKRGKNIIDQVASATGAFLLADWRSQVLRVWGSTQARDAAQATLNEHLARLAAPATIELQGRGVVRALIHKYGANLDAWASRFGAEAVCLDLKRAILSIAGSHDVVKHAQDSIAQLAGAMAGPGATEECGICFCPLEAVHIRLICGHIFCKACLKLQLQAECTGGNFTAISCAACSQSLALSEILHLTSHSQQQVLIDKAVGQFVRESEGRFRSCSTPGCCGIYKSDVCVDASLRPFMCPECGQSSCRSCGRSAHEGLTCAAASDSDNLASDSSLGALKKKIQEEILTLKCPRRDCKQAFDCFEGCCALTCSRCSCQFCGWCLKDCGNDAHGHVAKCSEKPDGVDPLYPSPTSKFEHHWIRKKERALSEELMKHGPVVRNALVSELSPILKLHQMRISNTLLSRSSLLAARLPEHGAVGQGPVGMAQARDQGVGVDTGTARPLAQGQREPHGIRRDEEIDRMPPCSVM